MSTEPNIEKVDKLPIVYSSNYDISFFKLEKLHVFDSCKWARIVNFLVVKSKVVTLSRIHTPSEATNEELEVGHSKEYLESLRSKSNVAKILEMFFLAVTPMFITDSKVLSRFRHQVKGTIMASKLALEKSWAINIGGGFHHASEKSGGGFCVYADISIAIKILKKEHPDFKFLIIDLDAHQGNGHERDFPPGNDVFIMDIYNLGIYPHDDEAKKNISVEVPIISWTNDEQYLEKLKEGLEKCFELVTPNLIVYNAGTDCLMGDPLGRLDLTRECIIARDEAVFVAAKERCVPIAMVTSGGYQYTNAEIIADSIINLFDKNIIQ